MSYLLVPLRRSIAAGPSSSSAHRRAYRDWVRIRSGNGDKAASARVNLNPTVYGHATSRGTRPYQEDTSSIACLNVAPADLRRSLSKGNRIAQEAQRRWQWPTQDDSLDTELAGQVVWFGIFDGHGGSFTSRYLSAYLHQIYEKVTPDMVTDTVQATRQHGGYFRRFAGGALERWVVKEELKPVRAGNVPGGGARQGKSSSAPSTEGAEGVASNDASADGPAVAAQQVQQGKPPEHAAGQAHRIAAGAPSTELPPWDDNDLTKRIPPPDGINDGEAMTLAERGTLAFLVADRHILGRHPQPQGEFPISSMHDPTASPLVPPRRRGIQTREMEERAVRESDKGSGKGGGSTASVLTLHSLDSPPTIWYESKLLQLSVYHVGDTRILLIPTSDGQVIPLTTHHHPDTPSESDRLRRLGAGVITDSFGESRWMGALANTRALGDGNFKSFGVTAEPEILSQVIKSEMYACAVMISDGINEVMSDQEAADLVRGTSHPNEAAKKILTFAEELGVEDNSTVVVVPLRGWGKIGGNDKTRKQREYRKSKVDVFRDHRN